MTDTPQWPSTSNADEHATTAFPNKSWFPSDPLDYRELPPLVFPRPLVDKALFDRDEEISDD